MPVTVVHLVKLISQLYREGEAYIYIYIYLRGTWSSCNKNMASNSYKVLHRRFYLVNEFVTDAILISCRNGQIHLLYFWLNGGRTPTTNYIKLYHIAYWWLYFLTLYRKIIRCTIINFAEKGLKVQNILWTYRYMQ